MRGIGLIEMKRLPALRGRRSSEREVLGRLVGRAQVFPGRAVAQVHLPHRDFVPVDEAAIEPQVIGAPHAHTQHCRLAVHGDAARANPLLRFASRCHAHAGEHFLKSFRLAARVLTARVRLYDAFRARLVPAAWPRLATRPARLARVPASVAPSLPSGLRRGNVSRGRSALERAPAEVAALGSDAPAKVAGAACARGRIWRGRATFGVRPGPRACAPNVLVVHGFAADHAPRDRNGRLAAIRQPERDRLLAMRRRREKAHPLDGPAAFSRWAAWRSEAALTARAGVASTLAAAWGVAAACGH